MLPKCLVLFVFFSGCWVFPLLAQDTQSGTTQLDSLYIQARALQKAAKYDSALQLFDQVIAQASSQKNWRTKAASYNAVAGINLDLGNYQEAERLLNDAINIAETQLDGEPVLTGESYYVLAYSHVLQTNYPMAAQNYQKAIKAYMQAYGEVNADLANAYSGLGTTYTFMEHSNQKALVAIYKSIEILKQLGMQSSIEIARSYADMGGAFQSMQAYDSAIHYYEESLRVKFEVLREHHPEFGVTYYQLASIYLSLGDVDGAIDYYQKTLETDMVNFGADHHWIGEDYLSLADCYNTLGSYDKAIRYARQGATILEKDEEEHQQELGRSYLILGTAYKGSGQTELAKNYFSRTAQVMEGLFRVNRSLNALKMLARAYNYLGSIALEQKEYAQAQQYHQKALSVILAVEDRPMGTLGDTYYSLADAFLEQKNYVEAYQYLDKAKALFLEIYGNAHASVAETLRLQGEVRLQEGKLSEALLLFESAVRNLMPDDTLSDEVVLSPVLVHSLGSLAKAKQRLYTQESDLAALKDAYRAVLQGVALVDSIRVSFVSTGSERNPLQDYLPIYERGLDIAHQLYQEEQDDHWLAQALDLMENSRSLQLLAALREADARAFSGVPDSILVQEKRLMLELSYAESQARQVDSLRGEWQQKGFALRQRYEALKKDLANTYPDYYKLRYQGNTVPLDQLQVSVLSDDELMLEFLLGDSSIFLLEVSREQAQLHKIKRNDIFDEQINDILAALRRKLPLPDFVNPARAVYQLLLEQSLALYSKNKLVIVPDGILAYLPFEVLLTSEAGEQASFRNLPYLTKTHQINYQYSATLMQEQMQRSREAKEMNYLAFAPDFNQPLNILASAETNGLPPEDTVRGQLSELRGTRREVQEIDRWMSGKFYEGEQASEAVFKEQSGKYNILHLATHAIVDDQYPMNSRLLFTPSADSLEDGNLHAWELYGLQLDADMVVLSACNTGYGKLQRGEGVMSLGRAFAYAGCPSVVMSLWPAQDQATADLMGYFYEAIADGMEKDAAMQTARLRYLEEADDLLSHPFYWAGFVVQGEPDALTASFALSDLLPYSVVALLLIPVLVLRRKKIFGRG